MSVNLEEAELHRLTVVKALVRREIEGTNDMVKKEVLRKKEEDLNRKLQAQLKSMNLL